MPRETFHIVPLYQLKDKLFASALVVVRREKRGRKRLLIIVRQETGGARSDKQLFRGQIGLRGGGGCLGD